ncbi:MAG: RodZ domain-containing protein [bacterium]
MEKIESVGQSLKKERELRFVTLKDIADATKINIKFLEAIENDCFDVLPAKTFVKGFLRNYARFVGLDSELVVTNYQKYISQLEANALNKEDHSEDKEKSSSIKRNPLFIGGGVFIAAILIFGGIISYNFLNNETELQKKGTKENENLVSPLISNNKESRMRNEERISPDKINMSSRNTKENEGLRMNAEERVLSDKETLPPPPIQPVQPIADSTPQPFSSDDLNKKNTLRLYAKEESWVEVIIDDQPKFDLIFKSGEQSKLWRANKKFYLNIGNAGGVDIDFNGERKTNLGKRGQPIKLEFPPEGR